MLAQAQQVGSYLGICDQLSQIQDPPTVHGEKSVLFNKVFWSGEIEND